MNAGKWFEINNWPIRYKLIMHFLLISIVPAICIGLLIGWAVGGTVERQANDNTNQLIGNVNKSLDAYANNIQNISYLIASNSDVSRFLTGGASAVAREEDQYRLNKFLESFSTLYPEVAGMMVVNSRGEYLSNELYARNGSNLTSESWYQEAVLNRGIFKLIGHPASRNVASHANYGEDEVVSFVRAILDPETQRPYGVVLIDLKLRVIAETVRDVRLGKSGYLMVMDESAHPIYAPPGSAAGAIAGSPAAGEDVGTFTRKVGKERLQFVFQRSPFTGWTTIGVFPVRESVREVRQVNLYLVTFVFIVCLLGLTASYYLSHSISRPISQLASHMRKVEPGNMRVIHADSRRQDEVGVLGRSFNTMLAQIDRLIGQVEEEQRHKREAELRSLQAHIQPHFLYNTLDTIQWLARKESALEAASVVESLSRLFRIGLSKGHEFIPLEEEMAHIRSYLQIQKTRYREKLNYDIAVDGRLLEIPVLKVILQPLVENAIYHGIKERRGPGRVEIEAVPDGGAMLLTVRDNGAGMTPERLDKLRCVLARTGVRPAEGANALAVEDPPSADTGAAASGSYGLVNVQERIRLQFGPAYGLSIDSRLHEGTIVTIRYPAAVQEGGARN